MLSSVEGARSLQRQSNGSNRFHRVNAPRASGKVQSPLQGFGFYRAWIPRPFGLGWYETRRWRFRLRAELFGVTSLRRDKMCENRQAGLVPRGWVGGGAQRSERPTREAALVPT
jgi:hypothetical protein